MRYLMAILFSFIVIINSHAQTFQGCEDMGANYTCYKIDSNNVHCYLEDSDADLDLDNDGVLDREFLFSTPRKNEKLKNNGRDSEGEIRNSEPEFYHHDTLQENKKGKKKEI